MGTRSMIAIQNPYSKRVVAVYCHWDGYLEHNGAILAEHYANSAKANNLIALGDISSLRPEIGVEHPFSRFETKMSDSEWDETYGNQCTFYGRDRKETGIEWKTAHTFDEFLSQVEACCGDYYYIMKDGTWYCGSMYEREEGLHRKLTPLAEAFEEATAI